MGVPERCINHRPSQRNDWPRIEPCADKDDRAVEFDGYASPHGVLVCIDTQIFRHQPFPEAVPCRCSRTRRKRAMSRI